MAVRMPAPIGVKAGALLVELIAVGTAGTRSYPRRPSGLPIASSRRHGFTE